MQVQVIGKVLRYGRKPYVPGAFVEMTKKDARIFMALGRVQIPLAAPSRIPAAPSVPLTVTEDNEQTSTKPESTEEEKSTEEVKPTEEDEPKKRRYNRRDMRAE